MTGLRKKAIHGAKWSIIQEAAEPQTITRKLTSWLRAAAREPIQPPWLPPWSPMRFASMSERPFR